MNFTESWNGIAHTLGYENEEEMLKDLYARQLFSIYDLAKKLGYSTGNVRRRLLLYGIPTRSRGGKNSKGKGKLHALTALELGGKAEDIAVKYGVHLSTVFGERRRRRLAVSNNSANTVLTES